MSIPKATMLSVSIAFIMLLGISHASEGGEVLTYRLTETKSMHLDDVTAAQQYATTLQNLGCSVKTAGHDGHYDLSYVCPKWQTANFDSHDAAHKWQRWLASLGFEVQHRHD